MAKNCGHHENYFLDIVHEKGHADWFLDAKEAKRHMLANKLKVPELQIDVKVQFEFKQCILFIIMGAYQKLKWKRTLNEYKFIKEEYDLVKTLARESAADFQEYYESFMLEKGS